MKSPWRDCNAVNSGWNVSGVNTPRRPRKVPMIPMNRSPVRQNCAKLRQPGSDGNSIAPPSSVRSALSGSRHAASSRTVRRANQARVADGPSSYSVIARQALAMARSTANFSVAIDEVANLTWCRANSAGDHSRARHSRSAFNRRIRVTAQMHRVARTARVRRLNHATFVPGVQ